MKFFITGFVAEFRLPEFSDVFYQVFLYLLVEASWAAELLLK
jgi:hypothetical protein